MRYGVAVQCGQLTTNSKIFCEANTSSRVEPIISNVNLIVKFSFNRDDGIVVLHSAGVGKFYIAQT